MNRLKFKYQEMSQHMNRRKSRDAQHLGGNDETTSHNMGPIYSINQVQDQNYSFQVVKKSAGRQSLLDEAQIALSQKHTIEDAPTNTSLSIRNNPKKKRGSVDKNDRSFSAGNTTGQGPVYFDFTEVFVWGDDSYGQLGLYHQKVKKGYQNIKSFRLPKTCSFNILIKQVSCGETHAAILTTSGHLYMMGNNSHGQLGIGDHCLEGFQNIGNHCAPAPCLVDTLRDMKISKVSCGSNFTIALIEGNTAQELNALYAWGNNEFGQLGLDSETMIENLPKRITCFEEQGVSIIGISAGRDHSLFLSDSGQVYGSGSNAHGQLGISVNSAYEETNGFPLLSLPKPLPIEALQGQVFQQVSAGHQHSLFLNDKGEVYATGCNQKNQLGTPDVVNSTSNPIKLLSLAKHRVVKVDAKANSAAITATGELYLWGMGVFGSYKTPNKVVSISNPVQDVCLGTSTLGSAIDAKGLLWTWGSNIAGELGIGDNEPKVTPYPVLSLKAKQVTQVACGSSFIVALGSNLKKELPGLKLNMKKVTSMQRRHQHRRNAEDINVSACKKSGGSRSQERSKSSVSQSGKKSRVKSYSRYTKGSAKDPQLASFSKQQSKTSFHKGIIIGNGALNSNCIQSPRDLSQEPHQERSTSKGPRSSKKQRSKTASNASTINVQRVDFKHIKAPSATIEEDHGQLNQSDFLAINHVSSASQHYDQHHQQQPTSINNQQQACHTSLATPVQTLHTYSQPVLSMVSQLPSIDFTAPAQPQQPHHPGKTAPELLFHLQHKLTSSKDATIKTLHQQLASLRTENDLLKRDNQLMSTQLTSLERQHAKLRELAGEQHAGELVRAREELKRREAEVDRLRAKKRSRKAKVREVEATLEAVKAERNGYARQLEEAAKQVQSYQEENRSLKTQLQQADARHQAQDQEIRDFERDLQSLRDQSKRVEQDLLHRLQDMSDRLKHTLADKEVIGAKLADIQSQVKDAQQYSTAIEKENQYLRLEVERVKYSKDKEGYSKFINGLIKPKERGQPDGAPLQEVSLTKQNTLRESQEHLLKSTLRSNIESRKSLERLPANATDPQQQHWSSLQQPSYKPETSIENKENGQDTNDAGVSKDDLKAQYNQRLLKSLERKTLRETVAVMQQPLIAKYR